jgi:type I restriction enzyme S subunit
MTAKDLKNALLQEAVQGKLVPQIASEGNARDLLEEIRKEKLSHGLDFANAKSGKRKSKKETALAGSNPCDIKEEEIPFEIPENWCWCRLGELAEIITKGSSPSWQGINYVDEGILFVTSENVGDEELLLSKRKFLEQKFNEIQPRSILQKGDILTNIVGASIGRTAIFDLDIKNANINQAVALIRLKNKQLNSYIVKVLNSKTIIDQMTDNTVNTARANISLTTVENFKIPLPPLTEQKRIVAAIEKFMPLVEEYGKKETELKAFNEQIGTLTKKAILQEAVQGKLVPQIAAEGNAKDLLEEIKKEKAKLIKEERIKKEKPLPEISDDEIPFDIPESWCWCRLGEIFDITMGQSPEGTNVGEFINGIEFHQGKIFFTNKWLSKSNQKTSEVTKLAEPNSILLCMRAPVGKVNLTDRQICIGRGLSAIKPRCNIPVEWAYYLFETLENEFIKKSTGSTFKAITGDIVKSQIIPLPPLAEQKRIVAAIEKMLPLCEKLGV